MAFGINALHGTHGAAAATSLLRGGCFAGTFFVAIYQADGLMKIFGFRVFFVGPLGTKSVPWRWRYPRDLLWPAGRRQCDGECVESRR